MPSLSGENAGMSIESTHGITGLVLAGGLGSRMGGLDKGLQSLVGKPLVAHVIERLAPQVGPLLISANRSREAYRAFGFPVLGDDIRGFAGPLAGVHAGLKVCTTPLLATVPCDSPFIPADLVARLREGLDRATASAAVARTADGLQPVFALMRRDVLTDLESFLATGGRGIQAWLERVPCTAVDFEDAAGFANINTLEELAESASRHS